MTDRSLALDTPANPEPAAADRGVKRTLWILVTLFSIGCHCCIIWTPHPTQSTITYQISIALNFPFSIRKTACILFRLSSLFRETL